MLKKIKHCILVTVSIFLFASTTYSQHLLTGRVLDRVGNQINFASIIDSETSFGTTTNKNGEFTLNIKKFPTTLIISSPYHSQKTIILTSKRKITIILQGKKTTFSSTRKRNKTKSSSNY